MSVDTTGWAEDPAGNKAIEGMSLEISAPVRNTAAMVATLMAAIKRGDMADAALATQVSALAQEWTAMDVSAILPAQIDSLFVGV